MTAKDQDQTSYEAEAPAPKIEESLGLAARRLEELRTEDPDNDEHYQRAAMKVQGAITHLGRRTQPGA